MSLAILAIATAVTAGPGLPGPAIGLGEMNTTRRLATLPQYPSGRADDVHRPGFNGRLWIGDINIGPVNHSWPMAFGEPGPSAYGAAGSEGDRAYAIIGQTAVGISPWIAFNEVGLGEFETARHDWLQERGYTGGVRTFVNDLYLEQYLGQQPAKPMASKIEPRGRIQLPEDMPRVKSREHVMHEAGTVTKSSIGKISLPFTASRELVQRVQITEAKVASK